LSPCGKRTGKSQDTDIEKVNESIIPFINLKRVELLNFASMSLMALFQIFQNHFTTLAVQF